MAAVVLIVTFAGCGYPQAAPRNMRLITTLRTALSARNETWLQQNIEAIDERRQAGEMSEEEYDAFQAIIAQAKAGEWEKAERASVRFQKAQRPTQEQIDALPKVKA